MDVELDDVAVGLILLNTLLILKKEIIREERKIVRRWWVRPIYQNRERQGHYHNLVQEMRLTDTDSFFQFTRMNYELFEELCALTHNSLRKKSIRPSIEPAQRLMITLRYLATGESYQSLAFSFRCGRSTVASIVPETCRVLWNTLMPKYLVLPDETKWKLIAEDFNNIWNYPNCLGALDGKHVTIECPKNTGSQFFNYKKSFSCILMATCDANYQFTSVDIGACGVQNDGGVFAASDLGKNLANGLLNIPQAKPLPGEEESLPFCFVGDEAFPLKPNLMRPFPGRKGVLPLDIKIFNYRLSRARRTIENAFGILVARWRIFLTPIKTTVENVDSIIQATVVLHNFLKIRNSSRYCPHNFVDNLDEPGEWRKEVNVDESAFRPVGPMGSNNRSLNATLIRNKFKDYFCSQQGSVPWQIKTVLRGFNHT